MSDIFEYYMSSDNCHFKYAKGRPSVSGEEFHDYNEIVLFIGGKAQFISKNIQITLAPNTIIFIPKEHFHQFCVADNASYTRCILGFSGDGDLNRLVEESMDRVMVIPNATDRMLSLYDGLKTASQDSFSSYETELLLKSAAVQLLFEKNISAKNLIYKNITVSLLAQRALGFIDKNYAHDIKLKDVALTLNVSVSALSHCFQKELNISAYKYITEKRLSSVRQYINSGMSLNTAASLSGFKDYSGFFRLYKKQYGEAPSDIIKNKKIVDK